MEDFENGKFIEADLENAFISLFQNMGYEYVSGEKNSRNFEDVILEEDLIKFVNSRYKDENLTDLEIQRIVNTIKLVSGTSLYIENREAYRLVSEGFDFKREDVNKIALHVDFIDFENVDNNNFKVVNQFTVKDKKTRRPDMLIFINGLPLGIFEFKSAIKEDTTIFDAWEQINIRYTRDIPKLLKYTCFSVISDGANSKLGTIFTPYPFYYAWNKINEEESVKNGISSLFTLVKGVFSKDRILKLIRDFIFYPDDSNKEVAIICRYPQFFAANKMFKNIKEHLKPLGDGKGGTYFGATGCGKTYTMLFLSRLISLRDNSVFKNPTIIILVDREDLNTQTSELFVTAKKYLHEEDIRSIESREDLSRTLLNKPSGGVYITTIQKFCESTGLLSDRENIICISDEAHRTQTGTGSKLKRTEDGIYTTYGFGYYLRTSFPNATYLGFTGTPIDETLAVFGDIVDKYTMKESSDDGITARIQYEPRLARVILSEEQAKEIQKYYDSCLEIGSTEEQIETSKRAMSRMSAILGHPDRLKRLASDMVNHYEALCNENPGIVKKAMIVCLDRLIAFKVLNEIKKIRPNWAESKKSENEGSLTKEELEELTSLPKINLVATRGQNDHEDLYEECGTKEHRKMLDRQFKNINSNFKIAIVVDMWITGFDVPSLAVMYIDKPLQKHTLIQTISRVNRIFDGKDKGLVVDYIGIKNDMLEAIKKYGSDTDTPIDELKVTLGIFRNHLSLVDELMCNFDANLFFNGNPLERLNCLNLAAEFVQVNKEMQVRFMGLTKRLKSAYNICFPSGELTETETAKSQFYLAIRSIILKQTKGDAPDSETMNKVVEEMVKEAITCTGIENIVDDKKNVDLFSEEFLDELSKVKLPITKFNALLKLLKKAIDVYSKTNKVKAIEFDTRLKNIIEKYNNRDSLVFTSEVVNDFINGLSDEIIKILNDLKYDKMSFEKLGITFEEKAFFDILIKVRNEHNFEYADEKCLILAKEIKKLVDDKSKYADWSTRNDVKSELNMDLTILLYKNGYPPEWNDEVFDKVMEQAENFKKYS
ncbi:type I restriction endonuclease subunit R [Fusobacterium necrophorum]|uniref:type I restriction endonuclease subunit R n=1 Tax=Fusobacterium necrophorum TaxID=859 RepID=UPI0010100CAC|nr:HsdR family type I site-specific deoxyribonuclease [Fusobacterium necrophorum]RXZ28643.1 type I restriction endonuclease subunit R [Fusobacterium necrophorum]